MGQVHYRILWVGRNAQDPLLDATQVYVKRLALYTPISLCRVREGPGLMERQALLDHLRYQAKSQARSPDRPDFIVALDERGIPLTTASFCETVQSWQHQGLRSVVFVIGGAQGLHLDVKARAHTLWALSGLTLPHRLAQVVLLEQLYRVHTMLRGEAYHRA